MVDFRSRNSGNSCLSERMLKNVIQVVDFEHRKVLFLESDFFEMSKRKVLRVIQSGAPSYSIGAQSYSNSFTKQWKFMLFSKMVLWVGLFHVLELSKQWEFIAF